MTRSERETRALLRQMRRWRKAKRAVAAPFLEQMRAIAARSESKQTQDQRTV